MSASDLAREFRETHAEVVGFVENCPDEAWTRLLPDGQRTVAAVAMHIARAYEMQLQGFIALARGEPPPTMFDDLDAINARNAEADRAATREDALRLLAGNAAAMEAFLSGLPAEALTGQVILGGQAGPSLEQIIRAGALGHPAFHLEELRAAASG